jgi:hypothetical protein
MITGGVLTVTGFLSWRRALTFSNKWLLLLAGDYLITQLALYEKDFGWMAFWELNPEVLGSLWLLASATWGGGGETLRLKATMMGAGGSCPCGNIPRHFH